MLLENRVAIVSGIGPGMGRDISLAFAREGADVVLAARGAASSTRSPPRCARSGGARCACPPTSPAADDCRRLVDAAHGEFGRIDVLVNNAFKGGVEPTVERGRHGATGARSSTSTSSARCS